MARDIHRARLWCAMLAALTVLAPLAAQEAAAQSEAPMLPPVIVTAPRSGQTDFDLPLSVDRVGRDAIQRDNAMVNLSEPLASVPGIVVQNRQNYAQDLQVSSRGFGARSTFGVRGVRLYVDGIPATMPDGQGQASNIDLASAGTIEVLRGPFSALYGNSSGGVISVFTENGRPGFALSPYAQIGSYDTRHFGIKASGQQGSRNYVLDVSRFDTGGYREHSAARRDLANAKLRITPDADSTITLVGNAVDMPDVQDPLGLSRAQMEADPRGVDRNALLFNTRKSVRQQQIGMHYQRLFGGADSLNLTLYGGQRATTQFLAISPAAQAAPGSAGGMIDLARRYAGLDLRWTRDSELGAGSLKWSAGISFDHLDEDRLGYENFFGGALGVQGRLRRDESNRVYNFDQYLQAQWEPGPRWLLLAGVRNSAVHVRSEDHYIAPGNGDDSGSTDYHALTPVLGATLRLSKRLHLYASYGRGFETPTLNELSYRSADTGGSGFNFSLRPSRSWHAEIGVKAALHRDWRLNFAVFHVDTDDELAVLSSSGGRAVYQNAGRTRRDGMELALQGKWKNGIGLLAAYSLLRARYADAFCPAACTAETRVQAGNRIPGVPAHSLYAELSWEHAASGFSGALEARQVGAVYVDDANTDAADSYFVTSLRAGFEQKSGLWRLREFLRIDNLADKAFGGSVIVNESNRRYFEPAAGRSILLGAAVTRSW